jgi:hypothetical protein
MAKYSRSEIEALCKRLEARAKSVVLRDQSEFVGDLEGGGPVAVVGGKGASPGSADVLQPFDRVTGPLLDETHYHG